MLLHRSSAPRRHGRLGLLAAGVVVSVVLVPGTAYAEETSPVPDPVGTAVEGTGVPGTTGTGEASGDRTGDTTGDTTGQEEAGAPELPPELQDAIAELAAALGVPQDCVDGVGASIELIIEGLTEIPVELQAALEDLLAQLEELGSAGPPDPSELENLPGAIEDVLAGGPPMSGEAEAKIVQGLELLGDTLSEKCMPAPPAAPEPTPPTQPPTPTPTPTTQPVAAPVAQQVVYPGYAPTGAAEPGEGSATGPLAAVGGAVLLLGAATAFGHRGRGRAVRSQD